MKATQELAKHVGVKPVCHFTASTLRKAVSGE